MRFIKNRPALFTAMLGIATFVAIAQPAMRRR